MNEIWRCIVGVGTGICVAISSFSQNLVPNPSFDSYKELPCGISVLPIQNSLESWFQPIITSTDFWHSDVPIDCEMNPVKVGVTARTGRGMTGIISVLYTFQGGTPFKVEYKEYLGVKLVSPIMPGNIYEASYYARNASPYAPGGPVLQTNNLGVLLSDSLIFDDDSETSPDHLFMAPQIEANSVLGKVWTKVGGCIVPEKQMEYLYIGNFRSSDSTIIQGSIVEDRGNSQAYYFIDDVAVKRLPYELGVLTDNIIYINNGYVELSARVNGALSYTWQDGQTTPQRPLAIDKKSSFFVDIEFPECTYRHTFRFGSIPQIDLGQDTTMCQGELLELKNKFSDVRVTWGDGSTDSVKYVTQAGTYSASTQTGGCTISDKITIGFVDCPGFIPNVITPNGDDFNQVLYFENINLRSWSLRVINRWGQDVYYEKEYHNDWAAEGVVEGIYYYRLFSAELNKEVSGWVHVKR